MSIKMTKDIQAIKKFNRFYVKEMGIFNLYADKSSYSATEAMFLFEIHNTEKCTVSYLTKEFLFDKGYVSRIVKNFEKKGIVRKIASEEDGRVYFIEITDKGGDDLRFLQARANEKVEETIENLEREDVEELIKAMERIEELLTKKIAKGEGNEKKSGSINSIDDDVIASSMY